MADDDSKVAAAAAAPKADGEEVEGADEAAPPPPPDLKLEDISEGTNDRGTIPKAKFIDDVDEFASSFQPPASAELLIGAYTELHSKYKAFESNFIQKSEFA